MKSSGPKVLPWGAPYDTTDGTDVALLVQTICFLLVR